MSKFTFDSMPVMQALKEEDIIRIHEQALEILENTGVKFEHPQMLKALGEKGCIVDLKNQILRIPPKLVEQALKAAPETFSMYNRKGEEVMRFGEGRSYYAAGPGSPNICGENFRRRTGTSADYVQALRVAEDSPAYHMVDASIVPCDVPQKITDLYILYQMMMHSDKTLVAEAWEQDSVKRIGRLMEALSGPEGRKKPYVLLAACPTPPMRWEKRVIDNVLDCMELEIPLFTCPSPVMGISSPVTIAGAILTHTVESLSFLTFIQLICPGHPVMYGGISSAMDMRSTYCSSSAIESCLFTAGFSCMAHYYGLPTAVFLAQTDAKETNYQAGFETSMDLMFSTLSGIDVVFGGGTLDSYLCTSTEKLVMDGQFFQYAQRMQSGIQVTEETLAAEEIMDIGWGGDGTFLEEEHTAEWYRDEQCMLNGIVDKINYEKYTSAGKTIGQRAEEYMQTCPDNLLTGPAADRLKAEFLKIAAEFDIDPAAIPML